MPADGVESAPIAVRPVKKPRGRLARGSIRKFATLWARVIAFKCGGINQAAAVSGLGFLFPKIRATQTLTSYIR
jgi:hypothetical protein